jgi:DNA helicase II / ATP-dependent DNA helicase PcrA
MKTQALEEALGRLTDVQREAAEWKTGALLVLAGPGSGKTQVLTCRIAKLLSDSGEANFRLLALTFTTKAADEMRARVQTFAPTLEERASIGTFHGFCTQVLRQHGVHLGIKPDFAVYNLDADRRAVLEDALRRAAREGKGVSLEDISYLTIIDRFKARLIEPEAVQSGHYNIADAEHAAEVYRLYEMELRRANALDFGSMIFEVYRLATKFPAIASRYQRSHPFWLIDEFQDTNDAQYRLIKAMAGEQFRNVFAVADDDQIIYQWNGASFRQLRRFSDDFAASMLQLPTNYRCPPTIVEAANRLVAYNAQRTKAKTPLQAGKTDLKLPTDKHLRLLPCRDETEESITVARDVATLGKENWNSVAVLSRTRALLDPIHRAFEELKVDSYIAQRRDDFLSPEFRWMVSLLQQVIRPLDHRNFVTFVESFNRITNLELVPDQLVAAAQLSGRTYFDQWISTVQEKNISDEGKALFGTAHLLAKDSGYREFLLQVLPVIDGLVADCGGQGDLADDARAWAEITTEISRQLGRDLPIEQFLQELALRSKEPSPKRNTVTLMTIHAAKGREFDFVYVVGLAEDVMPSFQSRRRGDKSAEMEEERRSCFVAITRTKESLTLSWAGSYRGYPKEPSRFLREMELIPEGEVP